MSLLMLALVFVVSCGGSEESDSTDTDISADTEPADTTDTTPADISDTGSKSECGNKIAEEGEICDGGAKECREIDPSLTGYTTCKADCSGWDTTACSSADNQDPGTPDGSEESPFERIIVDDNPYNPAFVTVDDLDNDGHLDLIVAQYGPATNLSMTGRFDIYWGSGNLNQWNKEELNISGEIKYPHPVKVADLNGDGKKDLVLPGGFLACEAIPVVGGPCGVLFWLEGTGTKNQWIRHDIVEMGYDHFFFDVELADLDGDGITDIVTNASKKVAVNFGLGGTEQNERLMWFKGTDTADRFDTTPRVIAEGNGGPFPRPIDFNKDGKLDIALAQYFNDNTATNGSFIWFEQPDDSIESEWTKHIIDNESGPSFMIEIIDNLYGDGVTRAVGVNHANTTDDPNSPKEGVFIFDIPADPAQKWPKKNIATDIKSRQSPATGPQAAPGLFGYGDITGNGLIDLVVSGDGDSRVFWFEQNPAGTFTQHTLDGVAGAAINSEGSFGQAGGMQIVDLDGDGKNEIVVTLYEDNKLYIYKYKK